MTTLKLGMSLVKKIESFGYEACIVGGAVRDFIMGRDPSDVDITTNCPVDILRREFNTFYVGKSKEYHTVIVRWNDVSFDVAQFRADGEYSDGRHPDNVRPVKDFRSDAARRDFTVNSMGMDSSGKILDYHDGIIDLNHRLIRAVGDPMVRFKEDHVRMVRAARFGAIKGFRIEKGTRRSIRKLFRLINKVTPERIRMELTKAAKKSGPQFARFILLLDDLKLLSQILPEVAAMKYFRHDLRHHPEGPTVFDHTIACLGIMGDNDYISKLGALFHDIGKCVSFQEDKYGWKLTYHQHERYSAPLAEDICNRLRFSLHEKQAMSFAALNHMKFHKILEMKPSKIARLINSTHFETLADVARADEYSRGERFMYHGQFDRIIQRATEIGERWKNRVTNRSINLVSGNRIMELANIKPGPMVGAIKRAVEDRIMDERLDPENVKLIDEIILDEAEKQTS